jgi:hypothetical protein
MMDSVASFLWKHRRMALMICLFLGSLRPAFVFQTNQFAHYFKSWEILSVTIAIANITTTTLNASAGGGGLRLVATHNGSRIERYISSPPPNSSLASLQLSHPRTIYNRTYLVDCECPTTCTTEALERNILVRNQSPTYAPFTCRQRIDKYIADGMTEREACSVAFAEEFSPCDSQCDPNQCLAVVKPSQDHQSPVLPTYQGNGTEDILILAAVPRSSGHTVALWSELECLATDYDRVIISSPKWSKSLIEEIVRRARDSLGMKIESHYYVNDRYDVGLWCDALQDLLNTATGMERIKSITLLNDSVYAFRSFSGILEALERRPHDLDMVSMNYYNHSGNYWLESVMRGFPIRSIPTFVERICQAPLSKYCPWSGPIKRKRCIVENFEISPAGNFFPNRTMGLFPSHPPSDWPNADKIWAEQPIFWKDVLVGQMGFPLAKVKVAPSHLSGPTDARLANCTRKMDRSFLLNFSYSGLVH